jgi:hypothetical protein
MQEEFLDSTFGHTSVFDVADDFHASQNQSTSSSTVHRGLNKNTTQLINDGAANDLAEDIFYATQNQSTSSSTVRRGLNKKRRTSYEVSVVSTMIM